MSDIAISRTSTQIVRYVGWCVLGLLAAFLVNNMLIVAFDYPALSFETGFAGKGAISIGVYLAGLALAVAAVALRPAPTLRQEAHSIHSFNLYLIRACFFTVLLTGVVDAALAFMRVENMLPAFFSDEMVRNLGRARFVGPYVHTPLIVVSLILALFSRTLGFTWLALLIVAAELGIVISRFVFSYEQALMGDLVRYWYAALFLFASAYTLYDEGHVRVDILYAGFTRRAKGRNNAIGSIFWGASTCFVILGIGLGSKQSIVNSPIANFEISQAGSIGMFTKYQMAAFIAIFAITMLIQFVSYFFESVADFRNEPGAREAAPVSH
ncbi:TRAP transporter small permease subunit [Pseudogemmobacter sp. W21_MBD1_M6]|uniref:TRAP transporter small permease subunit n=1 Tax=Pseudogemmobacter sp. W21_MBD1_M6 TaxID=3240271 RepID=UPI003F96D99A